MRKLIGTLVVLALFVYFSFQYFATGMVSGAMQQLFGTKVKVKSVHLRIFPIEVGIYGIKVMNYKGYEEPVMIAIPEVFVRANLSGLFKQTLHIRKLTFNLSQVTVEKNRQGKINLKDLMEYTQKQGQAAKTGAPLPQPQAPPSEPVQKPKGKPLKLKIDEAYMSLGKVNYVDYGSGSRVERHFDFNIENVLLRNAADMDSLSEQIVVMILKKIGMLAVGAQMEKVANDLLEGAKTKLATVFG
jgi:hypothetical protein